MSRSLPPNQYREPLRLRAAAAHGAPHEDHLQGNAAPAREGRHRVPPLPGGAEREDNIERYTMNMGHAFLVRRFDHLRSVINSDAQIED
jgi:hypothetical protein